MAKQAKSSSKKDKRDDKKTKLKKGAIKKAAAPKKGKEAKKGKESRKKDAPKKALKKVAKKAAAKPSKKSTKKAVSKKVTKKLQKQDAAKKVSTGKSTSKKSKIAKDSKKDSGKKKKSTAKAVANKDRSTKKPDSKKTPTAAPRKSGKKGKKPSNILHEPEINDPSIQKNDVPVTEKTEKPPMITQASRAPVPQDKYAVSKGTYHGHIDPTHSKPAIKPSPGKKPLWNSGNHKKTDNAGN